MSIRVECPSCQVAFGVGDEFAGKRGKCPKCKATIVVPAAATATPQPGPRQAAVEAAQPESYALAGTSAPKARVVSVSLASSAGTSIQPCSEIGLSNCDIW